MSHLFPPKGFGVLLTEEGRWYPMRVISDGQAQYCAPLESHMLCVPPAVGPIQRPEDGYRYRVEAIELCQQWDALLHNEDEWQQAAGEACEPFPERVAWYRDQLNGSLACEVDLVYTAFGAHAYALLPIEGAESPWLHLRGHGHDGEDVLRMLSEQVMAARGGQVCSNAFEAATRISHYLSLLEQWTGAAPTVSSSETGFSRPGGVHAFLLPSHQGEHLWRQGKGPTEEDALEDLCTQVWEALHPQALAAVGEGSEYHHG